MRNTRRRRSAGFSLVEVMAVTAVVVVLAGLFVQNGASSIDEAKCIACEKNRQTCEGMEQQFEHKFGRQSYGLYELVSAGYLNKASCPRGGVLTWEVIDPLLASTHQSLVCSIHGTKRWITQKGTGSELATTPAPAPDPVPVPPTDPVTPPDPVPVDPPPVPVDTTPPVPSGPALSDSFSRRVAVGWTVTSGKNWNVSDDSYLGGTTGKNKAEHRSFAGDASWKDYTLALDLKLEEGNTAGVFFRTTTPASPSGYVFGYDDAKKTFTLSTVTNGVIGTAFATAKPSGSFKWGSTHAVSIDVTGSTYTVSIDGAKVLSGTNSTYASGGIGLRAASNSIARFDNVVVTTK